MQHHRSKQPCFGIQFRCLYARHRRQMIAEQRFTGAIVFLHHAIQVGAHPDFQMIMPLPDIGKQQLWVTTLPPGTI